MTTTFKKEIFQINLDFRTIEELLENSSGELTEDITNLLETHQATLESNVKSMVSINKILEGEIETINKEIESLKQKIEIKTKLINIIKENLVEVVTKYGYEGKSGNKKLDYDIVKLYTVSSKSIFIKDELNFNNPDYTFYNLKEKINSTLKTELENLFESKNLISNFTKSINKELIKEAINDGKIVEGADIITKQTIRIR